MSMLKIAGRKETTIKEYLEKSVSGSSLKYSAVANAKHHIYIPTITNVEVDENGNEVSTESLIAYSVPIHELNLPGNKYRAVPCLAGVNYTDESGNVVNDGTCPFCGRVNDAWDITNYRIEIERNSNQYQGEQGADRLKAVERDIRGELKVSAKTPFLYLLIYVFNTDNQGKPIISESTGLPEYTPKVWKLRRSRVDKMQEQMINSGVSLGGAEIIIKYPDNKDARTIVSGSTTSVVFGDKSFIKAYPNLKEQIQSDASQFNWDGIDNAFTELSDMSTASALKIANDLFKDWDAYQTKLETNPSAVYLEYQKTPVISNAQPMQGVMQGNMLSQQNIVMPNQSNGLDANALFNGNNSLGI